MIDANHAYEMSKINISRITAEEYDQLEEYINRAAENGAMSISRPTIYKQNVEILQNLGYTVNMYRTDDYMHYNVVISWDMCK